MENFPNSRWPCQLIVIIIFRIYAKISKKCIKSILRKQRKEENGAGIKKVKILPDLDCSVSHFAQLNSALFSLFFFSLKNLIVELMFSSTSMKQTLIVQNNSLIRLKQLFWESAFQGLKNTANLDYLFAYFPQRFADSHSLIPHFAIFFIVQSHYLITHYFLS